MRIRIIIALICSMMLCNARGQAQGLYVGAELGYSLSMAENSMMSDIAKHPVPSCGIVLGYDFTPAYSLRLNAGLLSHTLRCGKAITALKPDVYGEGRYSFSVTSLTLSGMVNITNIFGNPAKPLPVELSLLAGGGVIRTGGFDEKMIGKWNELPYYPIDTKSSTYPTAHIGVQCSYPLENKPICLFAELRGNATDNAYNGVNNGNCIDFYIDIMAGVTYHFKGSKPRKAAVKDAPYIDPQLRSDKLHDEVYQRGAEMYTTVPFYASFHFLNNLTLKKVAHVADFMKKHKSMNVCVVGHPDVVEGQDEKTNLTLASKRAEAVKDALVKKFGIDEQRIRVTSVNEALKSLKTVGEWIPAVSFVME